MQEINQSTLKKEGAEESSVLQVANYSRCKGLFYLQHNNSGRALAHFNVALNLVPEWRAELKTNFLKALNGGCKKLEEEGKLQTAIDIREQALTIYPENEAVMCDIASLYVQLGNVAKALDFYQLSLDANPNFLPAFRALQSIKSMQLERWHFRMLNDTGRNKSYYDAIIEKIQEGHGLVLDIGTGSGLLSLYAVHAGAKHIYACEAQKSIFNLATEVIEANNCKDKITLINKMSTDLKISDDIPQKVSLVITEIFDAALFGEGILQTLIHAWDNLLLPPIPIPSEEGQHVRLSEDDKIHGTVIPQSASIWIAAIQCVDIARRYRLLPCQCLCREELFPASSNNYVTYGDNVLCKFCEAPITIAAQPVPESIISCLSNAAYIRSDVIEPYDVENLDIIPFGYRFLTEPYNLLNVNLNDLENLKRLLNCGLTEHTLIATEGGSVDAVVSWFQLNLDSSHTLSTAPSKHSKHPRGWCWHQAIFPFLYPTPVAPGETVVFSHSTNNGILKIYPNYGRKETIGIGDEISDKGYGFANIQAKPVFTVSNSIVTFLNNRSWTSALQKTATCLYQKFCSVSSSSYKILDFNHFPVLGLELLKLCNSSTCCWKLYFFAETFADVQYIMFVAETYGIKREQLESFQDQKQIQAIEDKFDVVNLSLVDSSGEMCEKAVDSIHCLRLKMSSNGVMIPQSISIEGQLIESDWLQKNSMVTSDENVGGFSVSKFVNNFVVGYHLDLNVHGMPHRSLSNPVEVMKLSTNLEGTGSLYSEEMKELVISSTKFGECSGFMYWIKLNLLPEVIPLTTHSYDSHCGQIAFLNQMPLVDQCQVFLRCWYHYGILKFEISRQSGCYS